MIGAKFQHQLSRQVKAFFRRLPLPSSQRISWKLKTVSGINYVAQPAVTFQRAAIGIIERLADTAAGNSCQPFDRVFFIKSER